MRSTCRHVDVQGCGVGAMSSARLRGSGRHGGRGGQICVPPLHPPLVQVLQNSVACRWVLMQLPMQSYMPYSRDGAALQSHAISHAFNMPTAHEPVLGLCSISISWGACRMPDHYGLHWLCCQLCHTFRPKVRLFGLSSIQPIV